MQAHRGDIQVQANESCQSERVTSSNVKQVMRIISKRTITVERVKLSTEPSRQVGHNSKS